MFWEDLEDKYGKNLKAFGIKTPSKSNIKKRPEAPSASHKENSGPTSGLPNQLARSGPLTERPIASPERANRQKEYVCSTPLVAMVDYHYFRKFSFKFLIAMKMCQILLSRNVQCLAPNALLRPSSMLTAKNQVC